MQRWKEMSKSIGEGAGFELKGELFIPMKVERRKLWEKVSL